MSNSLVRASLELFGYEDNLKKDKKKRRRNRTNSALDLIPINHRIVTKTSKKAETIHLKHSKKTSVNEAKRRFEAKIDPTEENVKRLLLLSGNKLNWDTADKLLERAHKKSHKKAEKKAVVPETTVFTEEDFEKFEKEYLEL